VAAFDSQGNKAPYSNYGAGVDIAAPGGATHESKQGGILQETIDRRNGKSKFEYFQGTSMATPHVAGVAAMLKSVGIKSPDQVFEILQKSAQAIEDDSRNYFGAGRLDAAAALTQAGNPLPWWPLPIFGDGFFRGWLWLDLESLYPLRELIYVLVTLALTTVLWLRSPFPIRGPMTVGLVLGSNGLFMLQVLYVVDLPQWPLRLAGSSIPELGSAATTSGQLNPIFASALVPLLLIALFLSESSLRWLAIGTAVGVAAVLGVNAAIDPNLLWLGDGVVARVYLAANAAFCLLLAGLALRSVLDTIRKSQV
jgi:serine protease